MKYFVLICMALLSCHVLAETVSGKITKVRENVAYLQTADGKKIPIILNDKTYYRKKKIMKKGRRTIEAPEFYQPLVTKGDEVVLTYDTETVDKTTGAIKVSDVLVVVND